MSKITIEKTEKQKDSHNIALFHSPRVLAEAALLAALSIVLGKVIPVLSIDWLRISFENLPILIAGILLGPLAGAAVGAVADLIGCLIVGYTVNPIITLGAVLIGAVSGLIYRLPLWSQRVRLPLAVASGHVIGSMIVKSIGLLLWFHLPVATILLRVPTYLIIAALECLIIKLLMTNRAFVGQMEKVAR